jgi:predicted dehydrogenase/threonine dehydrogenase-like Zn-dependent dehydrogenase
MLAILEDLKSGNVMSCDVPQPELQSGGILVRTAFSALSAGTERAHREQAEKSLLGKAMARPDLVRQVVDFARTEGVVAAYQRVQTRLNTLSPLGYSCAGTVVAVAEGVPEFEIGDRVACAGGGYANHSEINFVPRNLAAKVPPHVDLAAASLTTIGAIAMQGLRQSQATFGETVAVIGAGLLGILTVQLAKAAGCRVIAVDLDANRVQRAVEMGADLGLCSAGSDILPLVKEFTMFGADAAILTAATPSTGPIESAASMLRDRGRIVVVGDVGLGVSRANVYHKELSVVLSRSYGPGRYDHQYEEEGVDYPIGYVRWTERRNMEAFLQFLASGAIKVEPLLAHRYPVEQGDRAYAELKSSGCYTVLIQYVGAESKPRPQAVLAAEMKPSRSGLLRVGCIGAGSFATNVVFPAIRLSKLAEFHSVATASGIGTESARRSFGFRRTQNPADLIQDFDTDAVFVLSRHDSHARYVIAAISNHKPVFVEKPLAITREQLDEIRWAVGAEAEQGRPAFVMVGFNRRFAPLTIELRDFFANRKEPMMVHVRVNAGYLPPDHWTQQKDGGGRILGELCHFVDWARAVVGMPIDTVSARALPDRGRYNHDNVAATLGFQDGSIASILYLANGDKSVPKEYFEVFCEGRVARLDDFCALELARSGKSRRIKSARDKGHSREIAMTLKAMKEGGVAPIPFTELLEVSEASLAIANSIVTGATVRLQDSHLAQKAASGA